jgi:ABC-type antimicrobial peptide transport system permease subunit
VEQQDSKKIMSKGQNLLWLIRKKSGEIIGPLDYEGLKKEIQLNQFNVNLEICPENSYWFTLRENEELAKFFTKEELEEMLNPKNFLDQGLQNESTKQIIGPKKKEEENIKEKNLNQQSNDLSFKKTNQSLKTENFQLFSRQSLSVLFFIGIIAAIIGVIILINQLQV